MPAPLFAKKQPSEAVLTIWPPSPWAIIRGTQVCIELTTPHQLTPKIQS